MSGCALRRWGPGTTKERTPDTESAKQLESSLQSLLAARASLDSQFSPPLPQQPIPVKVPSVYITESSIIETATQPPQYSCVKDDTYSSDNLLKNSQGTKPQVQARTQLTSSMNWGAF
jgi:hypothetical protein